MTTLISLPSANSLPVSHPPNPQQFPAESSINPFFFLSLSASFSPPLILRGQQQARCRGLVEGEGGWEEEEEDKEECTESHLGRMRAG